MRLLAFSVVLSVVAACTAQPATPSPSPTRAPEPTLQPTGAVPASATIPSPQAAQRVELLAALVGAVGSQGREPAGGEMSCRGEVLVVIDMTRRPPLDLVTATFEIEMSQCPEGTELLDGHVHLWGPPFHVEPLYFSAGITRPVPIYGGAGTSISTNQGIHPRRAAEVVADPSKFGFYLHTVRNEVGGAGRGQLRFR